MQIETTTQEYIIRLSKSMFDTGEIDRLMNDLRLKEIASQLQGTEQEAGQLAQEINKNWWVSNRKHFIK